MSHSPSSEHRARLIREMSRDLNRTSRSSKGSNGNAESTTSSFDPENEALMSTRQIENISQRLPELRASAQKYGHYDRSEPDFAINTSAIGRAFPDFTQGSTSSDESSMSIELGRALKDENNNRNKRHGRSREFSSNIGGNSLDFSPAMVGSYEVIGTPPLRTSKASKRSNEPLNGSLRRNAQVRRASAVQKEVAEPSPPVAKTTDYGSGGSKDGSAEQRRTLSALHARVTDEDDASDISDDRPPTLNLTARSTRFGGTKTANGATATTLPSKFTSKQSLIDAMTNETASKQNPLISRVSNATVSSTNPGTQQSFMLPDMPNFSELVSGIFHDGTPVFSPHARSRASRFAPNSSSQQQRGKAERGYADVAGIPVPDDEQAIFVSLRLLQDKVAELETGKAEAQATIQDLRDKNQVLEREKLERKRIRRSDSALGTTDGSDGGDEQGKGSRRWIIEKTRLESTIRTLQEQAAVADRKSTVSDITHRNLTQERDNAVAQLGVAFLTTEQLKTENERLIQENIDLKNQLLELNTMNHSHVYDATRTEDGLQTKSRRKNKVGQDLYDMSCITEEAREAQGRADSKAIPSRQVNGEEKTDQEAEISAGQPEPKGMKKNKKTRMVVEEYSESEASDDSTPERKYNAYNAGLELRPTRPELSRSEPAVDATGDLTFLSFIETGEIAKLRRTLEQERIARKQQRGLSNKAAGIAGDATASGRIDTEVPRKETVLPKKSSMRDMTEQAGRKVDDTIHTQREFDQNTQSGQSTNHQRRRSEHSMLEERNQRRGLGMEDMTSAFILPDITMHNLGTKDDSAAKFSAAAQQIFDGLTNHNGQNCTICKRVIEHGSNHNHSESMKETIKIPKPVPVSERMPEATAYEEEPTVRPSQPPPIALATVMKGLEDELAHLKIQLSQYQTLYHQHDPALSKRKRKSVLAKIEKLVQAVDVKADQIYALYDVLEGQKADGHEISEDEIEITLQSVGIDLAGLGLRGGDLPEENGRKAQKAPWEIEDSDESDGELPWEGIETTFELTGKTGESRRRSWGA